MAVTFSGIAGSTVEISGGVSVNLATPATGQTTVVAQTKTNGTTAVTIHTVTAGKTFYCKEIQFLNANASGGEVEMLKADGSSTLFKARVNDAANTDGKCVIPMNAYSYAATVAIKAKCEAGLGTSVYVILIGHEE